MVDDSESIRDRLFAMLSELDGVEIVGQACNVQEAVCGIQEMKPDLIILDISLPGGSGMDVLESVKNGDSPPMVMILTNYPYPQYRRRCLEAGTDFFFDKSTEFDLAIRAVNGLVPGSGNEQQTETVT